jgi:hypothetical protein
LFYKSQRVTRHWWLTPVILATQEADVRRIMVRRQPRQIVPETISKTLITKKELAEWLKVKALSSRPRKDLSFYEP